MKIDPQKFALFLKEAVAREKELKEILARKKISGAKYEAAFVYGIALRLGLGIDYHAIENTLNHNKEIATLIENDPDFQKIIQPHFQHFPPHYKKMLYMALSFLVNVYWPELWLTVGLRDAVKTILDTIAERDLRETNEFLFSLLDIGYACLASSRILVDYNKPSLYALAPICTFLYQSGKPYLIQGVHTLGTVGKTISQLNETLIEAATEFTESMHGTSPYYN